MAEYYYATLLYHSGDKRRLVHKGKEPSKATMKLLGRIGASIEVQERLSPVEEGKYHEADVAHEKARSYAWQPALGEPEGDDDGDD